MATTIHSLDAREILDSRGSPTVAVAVRLADGTTATASVPSGASTGAAEAHELRDCDPYRFSGRGVLKAVSNVVERIGPALMGRDVTDQAGLDRRMLELDGTSNKSRLGANATLGVSMACARAGAAATGRPLYRHLGGPAGSTLPVPMMNVINGGKHARNSVVFQEFMIVPHGAATFAENLRHGVETYSSLRHILAERGLSTSIGDEGGFAPDLADDEAACLLLVEAIERAGYKPGTDISLALDPAASSFSANGVYDVPWASPVPIDGEALQAIYSNWSDRFPIVSIEDGFHEDDWSAFAEQTAALGDRVQIVGDDLYATNARLIRRGVAERSTNAVLIKPNQIGTITETVQAIEECRRAQWRFVVSHRSGETDDTFIADLAVAMGGGQIKTGAPCRGERTAKYNRLLEIERELGAEALLARPFA